MKKDWYKSKAMWGAAIAFVGAVLTAMGYVQVGQAVLGLGGTLGIVGVRAAQK